MEETWFEFMDRAKRNGLSPATQERIDKEKEADAFFNQTEVKTKKIIIRKK